MASAKDEWTEEKCVELIREYRNRPVLWDVKDPLFFKKAMKPEAWEEIAQSINVPADECKHKMIVLASSFRREKSKIMNSIRKGDPSTYTSTWFGFKELIFLMDKNSERIRQKRNADLDHHRDEDLPSVDNIILNHYLQSSQKTKTKHLTKKRRKVESKCQTSQRQNNSPTLATAQPSHSECEEEIASFTNFIGTKIKKYNESTKNAVQQAICEIIFKADQSLNESASSSIQSPETNMTHDDILLGTVEVDDIECETIVIKEEYFDSD